MARHVKDETGELFKVAKWCVKNNPTEFESLKLLKFLFSWRDEPRTDSAEGQTVYARTKVLGPELRDLFKKDVQIEVCEPIWRTLSVRWKRRLISHELRHIRIAWSDDVVEDEETGEEKVLPKQDKEGRIKVEVVPHDLVLRRFFADIEEWGLSDTEVAVAEYMSAALQRVKDGKLSTYVTPKALREPEEEAEDDG